MRIDGSFDGALVTIPPEETRVYQDVPNALELAGICRAQVGGEYRVNHERRTVGYRSLRCSYCHVDSIYAVIACGWRELAAGLAYASLVTGCVVRRTKVLLADDHRIVAEGLKS